MAIVIIALIIIIIFIIISSSSIIIISIIIVTCQYSSNLVLIIIIINNAARPSPRTAVAATTKGPRAARAPRGRRAATPLSRPRHARPHVASISSKLAGRAHHPTSSQ